MLLLRVFRVDFSGRASRLTVLACTIFALGVLLTQPGCGGPGEDLGEGVLAVAGDKQITVQEFISACRRGVPVELFKKQKMLSTLIANRLVSSKAHAEGIMNNKALYSRLENLRAEWFPLLLRKKVAEGIVVTDDELEMFRPTDIVPVLTVSMAIANTEQGAETARADIQGGAGFDDVVKKYPDEFKAQLTEGKVISLNDDMYPLGVRAMMNRLSPGELSPIARLDIGYAVFRLETRLDPEQQWEALKERTRAKLKREKLETAMRELLDELRVTEGVEYVETPDGQLTAVVGGTTVSPDQFMTTQDMDSPHAPHSGMQTDTVRRALENFVDRLLLSREAQRRGLQDEPSEMTALSLETEQIIADFYLDKLCEGLTATPEELQEYYYSNREQLATGSTVRISRILLSDEDEADEVMEKLEAGGDFAVLAKEYSKDETSADKGGDVGFVDLTRLSETIGAAVENLGVGEVGGPVKSDYGYEVLMVTEKRPGAVPEFADIQNTIRKRVLLTKRSEILEAFYDELYREYPVRINTDLLETIGR